MIETIAQRAIGALMGSAGVAALVVAAQGPWQATVCLSILGATALVSGAVIWWLK